MTEYRVGQRVRVEDVQEGIVTRVKRELIYVDGMARMTGDSSDGAMTRTITVIEEPKPDEPKLLGAVVLDRDGKAWVKVRFIDSRYLWRHLVDGRWRTWSGIDAVEVLFPGVKS